MEKTLFNRCQTLLCKLGFKQKLNDLDCDVYHFNFYLHFLFYELYKQKKIINRNNLKYTINASKIVFEKTE